MKNESRLPEEKYYMRGHRAFLNFTQNEECAMKKNARIILHVVLACYCFWMLAIICDEYFIASIHIFCQST